MPRTKKGTPPPTAATPAARPSVTVRLADGSRKDLLLGAFDSPASHEEYGRILVALAGNGGRWPGAPMSPASGDLTVNELCLAYWRHVERCYVVASQGSQ
jgi:hypothetical protein